MRFANNDLFSDPQLALEIANATASAWNEKAKIEGWPDRRTTSDFLRNRRAISKIYKGIIKSREIFPPETSSIEDIKNLITWILKSWNWQKSCPPIGLLESQSKWESLHLLLKEKAENQSLANQETQTKLSQWTQREFTLQIQSGASPEMARKYTEEFAKATGKLNGLSPKEKLHFCQQLEKLESYAKKN